MLRCRFISPFDTTAMLFIETLAKEVPSCRCWRGGDMDESVLSRKVLNMGVCEYRGTLFEALLLRESCYLGCVLGVPDFRKPPLPSEMREIASSRASFPQLLYLAMHKAGERESRLSKELT